MEGKNNGRRGDWRKYKIVTEDGDVVKMVVGMTQRRFLEKKCGWVFEEIKEVKE